MSKKASLLGVLVLLAVVGAIGLLFVRPARHTAGPTYVSETSSTIATPTAVAAPPVHSAPIVRVRIPRIGVDAGIVVLGVDPDGTMQSPKGPKEVAWYTFSSRPGEGGNVVLSGHVDYVNYGPAVFWRLRDLAAGDEVLITLEDGSEHHYRVSDITAYSADEADVAAVVGPTPTETLTLITCTGVFDSYAREYDKRLVVKATAS